MLSLYQEACKYIPGGVNSPVAVSRRRRRAHFSQEGGRLSVIAATDVVT